MSRSFRRIAKGGFCADSEKKEKRGWHQKMRARCHQVVYHALFHDAEDALMPLDNEVSDVWGMNKDGKYCFLDDWSYKPFCRSLPNLRGVRREMRK